MITDLTTKRIEAQSERQIYLRVLPTRYRQKSTGIDIEQNYVRAYSHLMDINKTGFSIYLLYIYDRPLTGINVLIAYG